MKRISLNCIVGFTVVLAVACGAGTPQNEVAREDATLALWPMTTNSDVAREQLTDGIHELDMGRFETAYEHFQRAIAADSSFALAETYAAFAATNAATLDAAYAHIARAVALSKNASQVEQLVVDASKKNFDSDDDGALATAQQLVKIDPKGARSWDLLAFLYDAVRKRDEARAARDTAIQLAPAFAGEYMSQSSSYAQTEPTDMVKAEQYARKAVELAPNDEGPYDILGDALRGQGKLEEAAAAYTKCAELDPTRGDGLQQRGHVQTFLGRWAEARADYEAAVSLATGNSKPSLAMYRAFVSLHEGQPKAALAELEQLYASVDAMNVPDPVGVKQFLLGSAIIPITTYLRMIPEAESAVERQKQLGELVMQRVKTVEFERLTRAFVALDAGYLAWAKGDYQGAQRKAEEYMKIRELDRAPTRNVPAHVLLGAVAAYQNRPADAIREFEQGDPDNALMNYVYAQALEKVGRTDDAQKMYSRVAQTYFNSVGVALVRRDVLTKVKKPAA